MAELADGETVEVKGSGSSIYTLKNSGGAYSCSCPAWRNQSVAAHRRTCKHLKKYRGEAVELARIAGEEAAVAAAKASNTTEEEKQEQAPPLLLAHSWENDIELEGWWMSEKLDGVRAYWNGKFLVSRLGNPFLAPDWFLDKLPDHPLDGELWLGRKQFQKTVGVVRRQDKGSQWKHISYLVFDAPSMDAPFEERLKHLEELLDKRKPPYARFHPHEVCKGLEHLRTELARVEGLGGEGLMLRKPGSKYEIGRSSTLLKVKTFHDAEAKIIGYLDGEGRHKGRVGALQVEMPDGKRFAVGTGLSDQERNKPPAIGTVITYRYQELSEAGIPRFPSYIGVRAEKTPPKAEAPKAKPPAAAALVTPPPAETPEKPSDPDAPQHYVLGEGKSAMFWEITVDNESYTERFGTVGSNGRTRKKKCADPATAKRIAKELIEEKVGAGYKRNP